MCISTASLKSLCMFLKSKRGKSHPIACMDFLLFPIEQSKHVIILLSDTDRIKAKLNKLQN